MCLIVFAWRPGHAHPLVMAANRDEFYARPTAPLAHWQDHAGVYAGRDLEAGGTWLGIGPHGRFAALTNIRQPGQAPGKRSRGELVAQFLTTGQSIEQYVGQINARSGDYAGFNLLLGDGERLCYLSSLAPAAQFLEEGFYGLSNAGLDTPWPKLLKARTGLRKSSDNPASLLTLLADPAAAADNQLPDTGVGMVTEKLLSSVFIASPNYGTRASTVLIAQADGQRLLIERSFGPHGGRLGEVHLTVAP